MGTNLKEITTTEHAERIEALLQKFNLVAIEWVMCGDTERMTLAKMDGMYLVNGKPSKCWLGYNTVSGMFSIKIGDTYTNKYEVYEISKDLNDIVNIANTYFAKAA